MRFFVFVWVLFFTTSIFSTPSAELAARNLEDLEKVIEKALHDFRVPGISVGVVVDGKVVLSKGYGMRDVDNQLPVTAETLFGIGSCTKAFTTFAIGTLADAGLLHWDVPVIDLLPEFRLWNQYATQNVTLRDLVTHRSGMPRHDFMWYNSRTPREELLKRIRYLEPACDFRERYNYGNLSYLAAGLAVERVTKLSWEDLVREKILKPLGMKATNFSVEEMKKSNNFSKPYVERNGILRTMRLRNIDNIGPAGSMNSNVQDLCPWMTMLLNQGVYQNKTLISSSTLQEMFAAQMIVAGYSENQDALLNAYGLGWCIHSYRGHYYLSHDGGVDGFTSVVSILPYDGIGVVVLSNKNLVNLPRYLTLEILDRIFALPKRDWLAQGLEQTQKSVKAESEAKQEENLERKKNTKPSHSLEDYVGEYEHPGYGVLTIGKQNGKLTSQFNGISNMLEHWHYDVFSVAEEAEDLLVSQVGNKYTFRNNVHGEIDELLVPFEPKSAEIVFKKKHDKNLSNLAYLQQFVGSYEIYHVTVEIILRDRALLAVIPGQPIFELIPLSENEFNVKTMSNYTVRFVKNGDGNVKEALLVLPYGAYTAQKKK